MHSKNNNNKSQNFIQGLRPFSSSIPHGLKKILKKNGYNFSNIVDNWTKMVGKDISNSCYPCKIKIGNNVWIGPNCTIFPGTTIKDNVVVMPNSLVKGGQINSYSLVKADGMIEEESQFVKSLSSKNK